MPELRSRRDVARLLRAQTAEIDEVDDPAFARVLAGIARSAQPTPALPQRRRSALRLAWVAAAVAVSTVGVAFAATDALSSQQEPPALDGPPGPSWYPSDPVLPGDRLGRTEPEEQAPPSRADGADDRGQEQEKADMSPERHEPRSQDGSSRDDAGDDEPADRPGDDGRDGSSGPEPRGDDDGDRDDRDGPEDGPADDDDPADSDTADSDTDTETGDGEESDDSTDSSEREPADD